MKAKLLLAAALMAITVAAIADWSITGATPTEREDNTPLGLSEIAGFKVYCGAEIGDYSEPETYYPGATLPDTTWIINDLTPGTHYCVITTIDIDDRESLYSEYVTLINDGKALPKPPMIVAGQVIRQVTTLE